MSVPVFLFTFTCVFALITCAFIFKVALSLSTKGVEVDFINLRWNLGKYLAIYKEMSKESNGRVGYSYYLVYFFFSLTALCFLGAVVAKIMIL